jgi:WD40 repeat protein
LDASGRALFARGPANEFRLACWSWWDAKHLWQTEDPVHLIPKLAAISPDGQRMATVTAPDDLDDLTVSAQVGISIPAEETFRPRPNIEVWHTATGRVRFSVNAADTVTSIVFSPDGNTLAWTSGNEVQVRDASSHNQLATLQGELKFKSTAFDPSGRILATAGNDGVIRFWDTATWTERVAFDWEMGAMWDVTFSADGLTAACCGMAGKIVVWDVDV